MTLQMERGENEEGSCVETNTSQKEQKITKNQAGRKTNYVLIQDG